MPTRKRSATKKGTIRGAPARPKSTESAAVRSPNEVSPAGESPSGFPIVAIGTGRDLAGIKDLLGTFGAEPGLAFVVVRQEQEMRATMLPQMLARATSLPVHVAIDGEKVNVNTVYVVPRHEQATIADGMLHLAANPLDPSMPLDGLLRSLAKEQGSRAVGVILSGAPSDGAKGSKAIKEQGGITFAQNEPEGETPGSGTSASAEFVLEPAGIGQELRRIAQRTSALRPRGAAAKLPEGDLVRLFQLLYEARDVDFTHYKPATIERRVRRRMAAVKVQTAADYVTLLTESADELDALYGDILIRVTSFFRDPAVFEMLAREIIPGMLRERREGTPLRIWVPGCATGEEVYSLAIALLETAADSYGCPVQIFGTDVSEPAIDRARAGFYPPTIAEEVSADRLRRFFTRSENGFRVNRSVRDCCVFARQNLTKDPPFSRLDFISCRNVLIYLGPVLQQRVMNIFHYALRDTGYLLLGNSETIGNFRDLFRPADRKARLYQRIASQRRQPVPYFAEGQSWLRRERSRMVQEHAGFPDLFREADNVLLARISPAGVLINAQMEILQFRGRTSPFLELAPGEASLNLSKMARHGLLPDLRIAIHAARKNGSPARREGIQIRGEGSQPISVSVEVLPFTNVAQEQHYLVLFQEQPPAEAKGRKKRGSAAAAPPSRLTERLRRELEATREYLQSIIEEQETMNGELRSASEESLTNNEELQSTNEELETAKEELQSSNEELTTLNEELENRNEQLNEANNDLQNILTSVDFPVVIFDSSLRIRRFNPGAQRVLNLGSADIGHSVRDLKLAIQIDNLDEKIIGVIKRLEVCELEVQDGAGRTYLLRIRPYKTMDNTIDGAVLVLIDVGRVRV